MTAPSLYPRAAYRPVAYQTRLMAKSIGLILHVQQGNNSPFGEFNNAKNGAMSHFWVAKTGAVEQYQDADRKSWAQVAGNLTYHSVETEGWTTEPLNAAQLDSLADLYYWGVGVYGWPLTLAELPGQKGFGWHGMGGKAWGGHTGCPGDLRKPQRSAILALLNAPQPPPEDDMATADEIASAIFQRMADADKALRTQPPVPLTPDEALAVAAADLLVHRTQAILATLPK